MKRQIYSSLAIASMLLTLSLRAFAEEPDPVAAAAEPPPLPFHTIEGVGGGAITPMAYLINAPAKGETLALPAVASSYVGLDKKNLQALTITENLFGRVELGYGADRLGLGDLPDDIEAATSVDIKRSDVWLHNFNLRVLALPENSFDLPLPAVTVGGHFKYNNGIKDINDRLGGALNSIGYQRDYGADFTITGTKMFTQLGGHPLILTAGGRLSQAANLGFLGFSDKWRPTFEGSVIFLPTSWLLLAYEFRQKHDPYQQIPGLVKGEDNWQAIDASWIVGSHATLVAGYGIFGTLANADANSAWWLQLKYEI